MRHGKREGTDAPRPVPERLGNQNRAKQTASANENGMFSQKQWDGDYKSHPRQIDWTELIHHSFPGSRRRC
jgi:hypothetical protein